MEIYYDNNITITHDNDENVLILKLYTLNFKGDTILNKNISLIDGITIKVGDSIYDDINLFDIGEDFKKYKYNKKITYVDYIRNEIGNIENTLYLYEEKEPWFKSILYRGYMNITYDPLFSKFNTDKNPNLLYIPRNKNVLKYMLKTTESRYDTNLNDNQKSYAILLKNIVREDIGMNNLNRVSKISFVNHFILSKSNLRALKINNLIL